MLLLSAPFDHARASRAALPWAALFQIAVATCALIVVGLALARAGGGLAPAWRAMAGAAVHAGFLAIGWAIVDGQRPGWRGHVLRLGAVLIAASLMSRARAWGVLAYLALPVALVLETRGRREFAGIGFALPRWRPAVVGLAAGIFLGSHLLIASSLTLGYAAWIHSPGDYLAAIAYDVGVSAVTAEWLFRGALFSWWWRQWALVPAAASSTAMVVLRYVLDPNLPAALEVWLGAAFYMGLLGASACALRAWSGSLVPGYLATVVFFLAYRALGH